MVPRTPVAICDRQIVCSIPRSRSIGLYFTWRLLIAAPMASWYKGWLGWSITAIIYSINSARKTFARMKLSIYQFLVHCLSLTLHAYIFSILTSAFTIKCHRAHQQKEFSSPMPWSSIIWFKKSRGILIKVRLSSRKAKTEGRVCYTFFCQQSVKLQGKH